MILKKINNIIFCSNSECPKKEYCERYSGIKPTDKKSFETNFKKHLDINQDQCMKFIPLGKLVPVEMDTFMHKLDIIPEPARSIAIGHASKNFDLFEIKTRFASTALFSFKWSTTPEGFDYWLKVMYWCQYNIDKIKVKNPGLFPEIPNLNSLYHQRYGFNFNEDDKNIHVEKH